MYNLKEKAAKLKEENLRKKKAHDKKRMMLVSQGIKFTKDLKPKKREPFGMSAIPVIDYQSTSTLPKRITKKAIKEARGHHGRKRKEYLTQHNKELINLNKDITDTAHRIRKTKEGQTGVRGGKIRSRLQLLNFTENRLLFLDMNEMYKDAHRNIHADKASPFVLSEMIKHNPLKYTIEMLHFILYRPYAALGGMLYTLMNTPIKVPLIYLIMLEAGIRHAIHFRDPQRAKCMISDITRIMVLCGINKDIGFKRLVRDMVKLNISSGINYIRVIRDILPLYVDRPEFNEYLVKETYAKKAKVLQKHREKVPPALIADLCENPEKLDSVPSGMFAHRGVPNAYFEVLNIILQLMLQYKPKNYETAMKLLVCCYLTHVKSGIASELKGVLDSEGNVYIENWGEFISKLILSMVQVPNVVLTEEEKELGIFGRIEKMQRNHRNSRKGSSAALPIMFLAVHQIRMAIIKSNLIANELFKEEFQEKYENDKTKKTMIVLHKEKSIVSSISEKKKRAAVLKANRTSKARARLMKEYNAGMANSAVLTTDEVNVLRDILKNKRGKGLC